MGRTKIHLEMRNYFTVSSLTVHNNFQSSSSESKELTVVKVTRAPKDKKKRKGEADTLNADNDEFDGGNDRQQEQKRMIILPIILKIALAYHR